MSGSRQADPEDEADDGDGVEGHRGAAEPRLDPLHAARA